ncbi:MAG: hypothetical protein IPM70_11140 [Proteobacteria bacterium]|nr:hypothetical protein [Pseudomonadota bacterium]
MLKRAMKPYLPRDIIYRPKTGFGAPLRKWVRSDLVPVIDETCCQSHASSVGEFNARNARTDRE